MQFTSKYWTGHSGKAEIAIFTDEISCSSFSQAPINGDFVVEGVENQNRSFLFSCTFIVVLKAFFLQFSYMLLRGGIHGAGFVRVQQRVLWTHTRQPLLSYGNGRMRDKLAHFIFIEKSDHAQDYVLYIYCVRNCLWFQ